MREPEMAAEPVRFGDVYAALVLWRRLGLGELFSAASQDPRPQASWFSVAAWIAVNRLVEPMPGWPRVVGSTSFCKSANRAGSLCLAFLRPPPGRRWHLLQWLLDLEDPIGGNVPKLLCDSGWPADFHQVHGFAGAQTEVGGTRARRSVSGSERNLIVLRHSACHHLNFCPDSIAVAFRAFQCEFDPVIAAGAVVEPHFGRCGESRDNHVQAPVTIQVSHCRAPMATRGLRGQAGFGGERLKPCGAQVAEHGVRLLHRNIGYITQGLNVTARDEDVLPAVVVEIGNGR